MPIFLGYDSQNIDAWTGDHPKIKLATHIKVSLKIFKHILILIQLGLQQDYYFGLCWCWNVPEYSDLSDKMHYCISLVFKVVY